MRILLASILIGLVSGYTCAQDQDAKQRLDAHQRAHEKLLDEYLPIVEFAAPKPTEPAARARRLAKDRRHNRRHNLLDQSIISETSLIRVMNTVYHWPPDFPPLPIKESQAIVVGQIISTMAHISENRSGVYSEVEIKVEDILKGVVADALVAEREGGRVKFSSGEILRYWVDGMGIPRIGRSYLLFLKQLDDGDFSIITGYELSNGHVIPLDQTGVVPFEKYRGADESKFLDEVRQLIDKNN